MKIFNTLVSIFGNDASVYKQRSRVVERSVIRDFEIDDFAGIWYEIARIDDNRAHGLSHVTRTFGVDADGMITLLTESLRKGSDSFEIEHTRIYVPDAGRQASMKVTGLPFTDREINILEIDADYSFALVGGRRADRLWILSRTPYIPQEDLSYLIARAIERGYDISNLVFPEHAAVLAPQEDLAYAM